MCAMFCCISVVSSEGRKDNLQIHIERRRKKKKKEKTCLKRKEKNRHKRREEKEGRLHWWAGRDSVMVGQSLLCETVVRPVVTWLADSVCADGSP